MWVYLKDLKVYSFRFPSFFLIHLGFFSFVIYIFLCYSMEFFLSDLHIHVPSIPRFCFWSFELIALIKRTTFFQISYCFWSADPYFVFFCNRYQRVSPDCLPLSNGRKPILRICKEDDADSGRIASCNGFEGKTHRFRPGSTPSSSQEHNFSQFLVSDSLQPENHTLAKSQINHESGSGGGDILLQWGQRKRSRGSRAESRTVADETPSQAKQTVKIHRRVVSGVEKRTTSAAMSPPSAVSSHNRTANHRPSMPVRETTAGSSLCRYATFRSLCFTIPCDGFCLRWLFLFPFFLLFDNLAS